METMEEEMADSKTKKWSMNKTLIKMVLQKLKVIAS